MTVLNNLYRRATAKPAPEFVELAWNHVGSLVEHIRATSPGFPPRSEIRSSILRGTLKIAGVPIRVVGVPPAVLQTHIDAIEGVKDAKD